MKKLFLLLPLFMFLSITSCEEDDSLLSPDLETLKKIKDTEILLRTNLWGFYDLVIDVKYEMRAIPLLANVADENGMVQPGQYNAYDIFGNDHRQKNYSYQFATAKVYRDTTNGEAFNSIGFYNVLSRNEMRMNPDSAGPAIYKYKYLEDEGLFTMTSNQIGNSSINEAVNQMIVNAIFEGKPNDIANAVVDKILGSEKIQEAIQQLLYDVIHGKVDEIAENPEEVAQKLATLIVEKVHAIEGVARGYGQVVILLEELKVDDPEQEAQALAEQIASRVEGSISQSEIYNSILPVLKNFEDETLPALVPNIADAIYGLIAKAFSEENIYGKVYPAWIKFSEIDSSKISSVADTLGSVLTNHFFDADDLALSLEPFITTLRSTSTLQIPALAQDIIDNELKPLVDDLNANFPGLELNPDWDNVKTVLSSALTVIKSSLAGKTDAEGAALLAQQVISIMNFVVVSGVESALLHLQDIPADLAAQVIAAWITNLVTVAEPQIVAFLTERLNALADLFSAEEVAQALSEQIHSTILEVFSEENIYDLILPVMEQLSELNVEAAAEKIAAWLADLNLIGDNVSEEDLLNALTDIISQLIGAINVDEASQKLTDLILQSQIVQDIDGTVLKQLLELKIYEFLIEVRHEINAIEKMELSLIKK